MRNRTLTSLACGAGLLLFAGALGAQVWEVDDHVLTLQTLQANGFLGWSVAIGDFDDDGYGDIVAGAPYWNSASAVDAGTFAVFAGGPDRAMTRLFNVIINSGTSSRTGWAVAAGDFDNDGRDEIAVGRPGAPIDGDDNAGAVTIYQYYPGEGWNLGVNLTQAVTTGTTPEPGDEFGSRLTVGNFDCDAYEDLAVGVPLEDSGATANAGAVHIFYGGVSGLRTDNDQFYWSLVLSAEEQFGYALAAGDFDADGCDDLAVGAPFRTVGGAANAGAVEILSGSVGGVVGTGRQTLTDQVFGYSPNVGDFFGWSLAAGNFNTSAFTCILNPDACYEDLAIGVPGQFITNDDAGKVMVAYGSAAGIRSDNETYLEPASVGAGPELNDRFGQTLAAGRLDHAPSLSSSYSDLAIGTVNEDYHQTDDGYIHLLFGASGGVDSAQQEQPLDLKPAFNLDSAADYDHWGWAMAIGDLDGDGCGDLVVGVPHKDVAGESAVGVVEVLYGALFADGFESQATVNW